MSEKWEGKAVIDKIERIALEMLWLAGQDMVTQATNEIPLDTGTLRRSGVVTVDAPPSPAAVFSEAQKGSVSNGPSAGMDAPAASDPKAPRVVVSYNTPYAIRLHETLWKPRNYKLLPNFGRRKGEQGPVLESGDFRKRKWRRVPKPAVGRNKWLERAIPKISERIQNGVYLSRAKKKVGL